MDAKQITDKISVSVQLTEADIKAAAEAEKVTVK